MGRVNNAWNYITKHKYLITIVVGLLIVGVLDENSFRRYAMLQMRLNEVKEELQACRDQYERDSARLSQLNANVKGVERIARERYLMKRPNEDIFVLDIDQQKEAEEKR
jgi:uncharacterized membrane-anchored protein YhcB (DUF1043 family)